MQVTLWTSRPISQDFACEHCDAKSYPTVEFNAVQLEGEVKVSVKFRVCVTCLTTAVKSARQEVDEYYEYMTGGTDEQED